MISELKGVDKLSRKLSDMGNMSFDGVVDDNLKQMYSRAMKPGFTPVDSGSLRRSCSVRDHELIYSAEYASSVEYGHRGRDGKFVKGQYFLKRNIDLQRKQFRQDLAEAMKKGG